MQLILQILVILLASINLLMIRFALFRLHQPTTLFLWLIKVFVSALSPVLFFVGIIVAISGLILNSWLAIAFGSCSALLYLIHITKISSTTERFTGFEKAFGEQWKNYIPQGRKYRFLPNRYVLKLPKSPDPVFSQNISFYTIPGTNRQLLCDIWQPPKSISHSGLAFIYLHGSAWTALDKDYGTRTFFRHLAAQGHVIMDVAYRLFPETDFMGMVHDAKHAIAWMKANAVAYNINPERIVIGGGSAGAHIALLTAYTNQSEEFMPMDLEAVDLSVRGVISLYGQADLVATYYHTCQHLTSHSALGKKKNGGSGGMPSWIQKKMGEDFHRLGFDKDVEPGILAPMLGGNPDEKPEAYSLFSPITHVHKGCPPTLLIHGKYDILAPVEAIRHLHTRLTDVCVAAVIRLIPQTDHAFDLILPKISPSAHNAYYDVERFLSLMV
ncbi:alpha/beta hydrolase fold domain-containing protein [Terrimonas alba]|uniref:alpha/beta hydrolase fold domain-containing protein n=1 Tax=Terrimonas alba TaxID=3349636 RepID=UPI0035F2D27D